MVNPYEGFEHSIAQKEDSKYLKIVAGEPDLRNPSSFENIADCLDTASASTHFSTLD